MKKFFLLFISLHFFQFSFSQDYYAEPFTELGYANGIREPGAIISDNYLMLYSYYYSGNGLIKIYDLSNDSIDFFAEKEFLRWHPNDPAGGSNFATVNGAAFDGPDNILASGLIGYPGSTTISALRKYGTDASPQIEKICQSCFANPIIINGNYYIVLANDTADGQVMDLLSTGWTNLLRPDNKQQNFILALDNNLNERWIFDPETIYPTGSYNDTTHILEITSLVNGNLLVKALRNRSDLHPNERYLYFFEINSQTGAFVRELITFPPAGYTTTDYYSCHLKQDPYTSDFYYNYSFNPDGQLQTPGITNMMRFDENMNLLASADWWTKTGDDFEIFENTIITKNPRRRVISKDDFTLNYTKGGILGSNTPIFTSINKSIFMVTYQYNFTINPGAWNETTIIYNGSGRRDNNYFYEMSNIENLSSRSYALATYPILAAYNYKERVSGTNNLVDTDKHISYLVFPSGFDFSQYDTFDPNVPNDTFDEAPSDWFNIPAGMTICAAPFELDEDGNYFIRLITTPTGELPALRHFYHTSEFLKVYLTTDNLTDLSVNEHNKLSFSFYPNPTANIIHIKNNSMGTISKITILNSVGQKLLTQFNSDNINISSLKNGVYFIKVTFNNGSNGLSKFIKKSP